MFSKFSFFFLVWIIKLSLSLKVYIGFWNSGSFASGWFPGREIFWILGNSQKLSQMNIFFFGFGFEVEGLFRGCFLFFINFLQQNRGWMLRLLTSDNEFCEIESCFWAYLCIRSALVAANVLIGRWEIGERRRK